MAQHSVILSESEYEELKGRGGCFTGGLVILGFIILLIYGGVYGFDGDKKEEGTANEEAVAEEGVSPETPVEHSSSEEIVAKPIAEPVVASEELEEQATPVPDEHEAAVIPAGDSTPSVEELKAEQQEEPQLSRKERRALRRAQKKAEKDERFRREMEEENN